MALAVLKSRVDPKPVDTDHPDQIEPPVAVTEEDATDLADVLANLRVGFSHFSGYGRGFCGAGYVGDPSQV